jgi:hypothetical protein
MVGDAISVAKKKISQFWSILTISLAPFGKPGDRFPQGSRSPSARNEGEIVALHAFLAFLLSLRVPCVRLCAELRPGLPSRDRHLRR